MIDNNIYIEMWARNKLSSGLGIEKYWRKLTTRDYRKEKSEQERKIYV